MEQYLATVIQNEIVFHCKLEQTKIEMSQISDYKVGRLFRVLDQGKRGYVNGGNIRRYL